ncbi:class I SAM-dependent methyltransferase, partial [Candidatus Micrarchaeota archaeon]|nr:class I SAM-dependent methyltransferase [Candidatus Micrarchaeota archaeon]
MGKQYLIDRKWLTDAEAKNFISEKIRNINSFYSGRLKLTFDLLEIKSGMKVLDVGCHLGFVDYYLAKSNPSAEFYGVDIVPDFIELANKYVRLPNLSYDTQDILNNNFKDNTFDYVLFLETIEHVANPAAYASEFLRILKPGGCLVLSTPNAIGITNVLHNLKHMNDVKKIEDEARNTGTE